MGSKALMTRHWLEIVGKGPRGGGLELVEFAVPSDVAASYTTPGQYVEIDVGRDAETKTGYFALAGDPRARTWEFFVGRGGEAAEVLRSLPVGATVLASAALGEGFPYQAAAGERLLVVGTGSGISAIRPLLRQRIADGWAAATHAYIGVRTPGDMPIGDEIAAWREAGMDVVVCYSQHADSTGAGSFAGYVQHAVVERHARPDAAEIPPTRVFAVGLPAMVQQLRELVPSLGIRREDVHTNY